MLMRSTRRGLFLAAAALALVATGGAVVAEGYPEKPITFVVPWPAGGRTDIVGRMAASVFGSHVGQPVAVDPSRAPDGKWIFWIQLQQIPRILKGDARMWYWATVLARWGGVWASRCL